jgi:hypothetical protein
VNIEIIPDNIDGPGGITRGSSLHKGKQRLRVALGPQCPSTSPVRTSKVQPNPDSMGTQGCALKHPPHLALTQKHAGLASERGRQGRQRPNRLEWRPSRKRR